MSSPILPETFNFPGLEPLRECLENHPQLKKDYYMEKKEFKTNIAKFAAVLLSDKEEIPREAITFVSQHVIDSCDKMSRSSVKKGMRQETRNYLSKNLEGALVDCTRSTWSDSIGEIFRTAWGGKQ